MKVKPKASTIFKSRSQSDTLRLAGALAGLLKGGEVLSLKGMIGAGKTFFVKGLAGALGSRTSPVSASFNLMRTYKGGKRAKLNLYHFDLFRISPEEMANIGLEDYLGIEDGVTAIEWASSAEYLYGRGDFLELDFELAGGDTRDISARASGASAKRILEGLKIKWLKN
ncbi:MAG: tRNA (adenosine(37)-N6)-threonylcarbamoyltransferase complex ATPase subunit type 1 TsaE [Elusimicrobiota bacterium]